MTNEVYTLVHRGNFGSVAFSYFSDREKMKQVILQNINKGDECYILPGQIELVDFNIRNDGNFATEIHMEDEPDYTIPVKISTVVIGHSFVEKFTKKC